MNVVLGGTIYQDLRTDWPKDRPPLMRHRLMGRVSSSAWVTHPVQLARPNSRLARAVKGRGELGRPALDAVLSMHHQAVETLASGLEVSATAPDGVIEAFEETTPLSSIDFWERKVKKERQDAAICYDEKTTDSSKAGERICLARIDYRNGHKKCQWPLPI